MRGGIPVGIGPGGQEVPIRATAAGALLVDATDAQAAADDPLALIARTLALLLLEQRATRLAVEELVNAGLDDKTDFLELAEAGDEDYTEEP